MEEEWENPYSNYNRFENLDGIETKIVSHLIYSKSKHADVLWKLLKYGDQQALIHDSVPIEERKKLVCIDSNGETKGKRVFLTPSDDNAQSEQCSSVYIYVRDAVAIDIARAVVRVSIDTSTATKSGIISADADEFISRNPEQVNPNESDEQGSIVVPYKSRETTLLKSILAEINGLYLDGIGYINFAGSKKNVGGTAEFNKAQTDRSFYGHRISFVMEISGVSTSSSVGY